MADARKIVANALDLGQALEYHEVTKGDGNCFYHALLDQVRNRPEISRLIRPIVAQSGALNDHLSLRKELVGFVGEDANPTELGQTESSFREFLFAQARPSVYAQDSVTNLAPKYLGVDIWLISTDNRPSQPYTKMISGYVPTEAHIILGYIPGHHFQSLYPVTGAGVNLATGAPPAKKSRLSDVERLRLSRAVESEDMRTTRLDKDARKKAEKRKAETSAERQQRLAAETLHKAQAKQAESPAERQQRLAAEALHKAQAKQAESPAERQQRLAAEALHKAQAKQAESPAERQQRLAAEALHKAQAKQAESPAERQQRLAAETLHKAQAKQAESPAERQQRLAAEALHKAQAKQAESPAERQQRLASKASHQSQVRQTESSAENERRRTADARHKSLTRQAETASERAERLTAASQAMSQMRESRRSQTSTLPDVAEPAEPARPEFWEHGLEFHRAMESRDFLICVTCHELQFTVTDNDDSRYVCKRCTKDPVTFSAENDMDPGPVPKELTGLTQVEQLLIAQIIPMMTIVRLPRGGQFGYSGNIINLPQDLPSLVSSLSRRVTDTDIVVIRKQLEENTHHDFRVRRNVIHRALRYLKDHNPFYGHIDINDDNLQLLPEDDFVDVTSVQVPDAGEAAFADEQQPSTPADAAPCDGDTLAEMPSTFVALNIPRATETAAVEEALHVAPIQWPAVADRPVNEFETVGYVTRCFPALFPTGAAELRTMQPREKRVTEPPYFKHLMLYKDQRFAQHPRFRYFAYNTLIRHRSLATGRMYLRQHPDSAARAPEEILALPQEERRRLAHDIVRFGGHLRGSRQYWLSQRENLMALIKQLGTPHCYFTLSSADMQWPDLQGYLRRFGGVQSPSAAVASNPMLCTWYMHERVVLFVESFLRDVLGLHSYWARHPTRSSTCLRGHPTRKHVPGPFDGLRRQLGHGVAPGATGSGSAVRAARSTSVREALRRRR